MRKLLTIGGIIAAAMLTACGDDDSEPSATTTAPAVELTTAGNGADLAFINAMVPHHEMAVEMAELARKQASTAFVQNLADDIIDALQREITTMQALKSRLDKAGVREADLGVPEHMMGMDADMAELERARPFDRALIDEMVPHHQGAIMMARAELAKGNNAQLMQLAQAIIDAQSREINAMNDAREKKYGAASPAGGVPSAEDEDAQGDGHGG